MMRTPYLQSLTPFPVQIDENGLEGELDFRYNREDNYMVISFKYRNKDHDPAPVIVYTEVSGKRYRHVLFVVDQCNKLVKTALFRPEYNVWDGIRLCGIGLFVYREEGGGFLEEC
jgi:hypothetical protein